METIRAVFGHGWVQFIWTAFGWGVCLHAAFAAEKDFAKPNRGARIAWRFLVMAALGAIDFVLCWHQDEDGGPGVAAVALVMIAITAIVLSDKLRAEKKAAELERQRKEIERQIAEEKEWQPEEDEATDVPPAWEIDE